MKSMWCRCLLTIAVAVSIAFALALSTPAMADLITLKVPGIPGDLKVNGEEGVIEVMSLSNSVQNSSVVGSGSGGAGTSKLVPSDMVINKRLDASSPPLFLAMVTGKHFPNAVITFLQENEKGNLTKFFTFTLSNVVVSKLETNASENQVLTEKINLNYSRIQLKDEASGQQACWDIPSNTSC